MAELVAQRDVQLLAALTNSRYQEQRTVMHSALIDALAAELPAPGKVLDLGGSDGLLAVRLRSRFPHAKIASLDLDAELTRRTARLTPSGRAARYLVGDVQSLPFADCTFSAATTSAIACWIDGGVAGSWGQETTQPRGWAQEAGLREIARVLRPGGCLVALSHGMGLPGKVRVMPDLGELVAAAGLRVVSAGGISDPPDLTTPAPGAHPLEVDMWYFRTRAAQGRPVTVTARKPGRRRHGS
jgi:SAM-dependent methyltransferase